MGCEASKQVSAPVQSRPPVNSLAHPTPSPPPKLSPALPAEVAGTPVSEARSSPNVKAAPSAVPVPAPVSHDVATDVVTTITQLQPFDDGKPGADEDMEELDRLLSQPQSDLVKKPLEHLMSDKFTGAVRVQEVKVIASPSTHALSSMATPSPRTDPTETTTSTSAPEPAAQADPWASLQSAYKVEEGRQGAGAAAATAGIGRKPVLPPVRRPGALPSLDDTELVLDEGVAMPMAAKAAPSRQIRPPPKPLGAVGKQGNWGQGDMAAAGTLMVGDTDLDRLAPPGAAVAHALYEEQDYLQAEMEVPALATMQASMAVEDIEDLDLTALEPPRANFQDVDLAAKLAKFEAMQDDDDY